MARLVISVYALCLWLAVVVVAEESTDVQLLDDLMGEPEAPPPVRRAASLSAQDSYSLITNRGGEAETTDPDEQLGESEGLGKSDSDWESFSSSKAGKKLLTANISDNPGLPGAKGDAGHLIELRAAFLSGWKASEKTFNHGIPNCDPSRNDPDVPAMNQETAARPAPKGAPKEFKYVKQCPRGTQWIPRAQLERAEFHNSPTDETIRLWRKWVETDLVKELLLPAVESQGSCVDSRITSMFVARGECVTETGCECSDGKYMPVLERNEKTVLSVFNSILGMMHQANPYLCEDCGRSGHTGALMCPLNRSDIANQVNQLGEGSKWSMLTAPKRDKVAIKLTSTEREPDVMPTDEEQMRRLMAAKAAQGAVRVFVRQVPKTARSPVRNALYGLVAGGLKGAIKGIRYSTRSEPQGNMRVWNWAKSKFLKAFGSKLGITPQKTGSFCERFGQIFSDKEPTFLSANMSKSKMVLSYGLSTFYVTKAPKEWWEKAASLVHDGRVYCNPGSYTPALIKAKMLEPGFSQGCIKSIPQFDSDGAAFWPNSTADSPQHLSEDEEQTLMVTYDKKLRKNVYQKFKSVPTGPPTCSARIQVRMMQCTTCCCRQGMFTSNVETKLIQGDMTSCGAWFTTFDSMARATLTMWRATIAFNKHSPVCYDDAYNPLDFTVGWGERKTHPSRIKGKVTSFPPKKMWDQEVGEKELFGKWLEYKAKYGIAGSGETFMETIYNAKSP